VPDQISKKSFDQETGKGLKNSENTHGTQKQFEKLFCTKNNLKNCSTAKKQFEKLFCTKNNLKNCSAQKTI